jgi:hypothetical protein
VKSTYRGEREEFPGQRGGCILAHLNRDGPSGRARNTPQRMQRALPEGTRIDGLYNWAPGIADHTSFPVYYQLGLAASPARAHLSVSGRLWRRSYGPVGGFVSLLAWNFSHKVCASRLMNPSTVPRPKRHLSLRTTTVEFRGL